MGDISGEEIHAGLRVNGALIHKKGDVEGGSSGRGEGREAPSRGW